ncbi:hypothetical protein [Actinoplanes subtropicus]|uniref:COG4705 family protein n=1 Tax=Actinoplanes subtropicus TaxID=543632 RepID=UPI00068E0645|nr:hypothetical protein [Actinoplanes subtropicus]
MNIPQTSAAPAAGARARTPFSKVPEATALFWVIKILTTGMGECVSDDLMERLDWWALGVGGAALVASLWWQFRTDRYRAWPYWTAVAMVSVFGTMVADGLRKGLGLTFVDTTIAFSVLVAASLGTWYLSERTLSIHSITTRRRETFYWATVMATFALGTAVGDMFASTLGWGFLESGLGFCVLIVLPLLAYKFLGLNSVLAFWSAYVVTRPLGASFADYLWVPRPWGAGFGKDAVSLVSSTVFLLAVVYAAKTRNGEPKDARAVAG